MPREKMDIDERYVYQSVQYERYRVANRREKSALLAKMAAVTGKRVKSLTRAMRRPPGRNPGIKSSSVRMVSRWATSSGASIAPWITGDANDCSRFWALVDHLQALGRLTCTPERRQQIAAASVSRVGRILTRIRQDAPRLDSSTASISQIQWPAPAQKVA